MEASLANLSSVLTLLGQRTWGMESRVNASLADDDTQLTYTRWGRTECPEDTGAMLVYAGEYIAVFVFRATINILAYAGGNNLLKITNINLFSLQHVHSLFRF